MKSKFMKLSSSLLQKEKILTATASMSQTSQLVYRDLVLLLSLRHFQLKNGFRSCSELSTQVPSAALDETEVFTGNGETRKILSFHHRNSLLSTKSNVYESQFWHSFEQAKFRFENIEAKKTYFVEEYEKKADHSKTETFGVQNSLEEPAKKSPDSSWFLAGSSAEKHARLTELQYFFRIQSLKSYVSICSENNMVDRAYFTLCHRFREFHRLKATIFRYLDAELFNMVLQGLVDGKGLNRVRMATSILALMDRYHVKANLNTVAQLFLILKPQEVMRFVNQEQLRLEDIFVDNHYSVDHQKRIMNAIRDVKPDICFTESAEVRNIMKPYGCSLLDGLRKEEDSDVAPSTSSTSSSSSACLPLHLHPYKGLFTRDSMLSMFKAQMDMELSNSVMVDNVTTADYSKRVMKDGIDAPEDPSQRALYEQKMDEMRRQWKITLHSAMLKRRQQVADKMAIDKRGMGIDPFLKCISTSDFTDILYEEVMFLCTLPDDYSQALNIYCEQLGERVMQRYHIKLRRERNIFDKISDIYLKYFEYFLDPSIPRRYNHRQYWNICACSLYHLNPSVTTEFQEWTPNDKFLVGRELYSIIIDEVKVPSFLRVDDGELTTGPLTNAFYTIYHDVDGKTQEEVRLNPVLIDLLLNTSPSSLKFDVLSLPMLCPPVPWHDTTAGLYLFSSFAFVRISPYTQKQQKLQQWKAVIDKDSSLAAMDCLNQLGSVPWIVNKRVLDVMLTIFRDKGDEKLSIPRSPWNLPKLPKIISADHQEMVKILKVRSEIKKLRTKVYSLWCATLYKLSIANHFRDRVLFFPHNLDFRGRVYPFPRYFNHIGDDVSRGLLKFAKGYPLGKDGLNWLKLHCVNLTGSKKRDAVAIRLKYAEEKMDDILDSADNPLTGRRWWTKSDEPWQTLACCIEIADAVRSPNPEEHICHFPVHQDGSCNGLQHYAALGRDSIGAHQVNLRAVDTPQDVYSGVATLVEAKRQRDAAAGMAIAQSLKGVVKRKLVKQTVMTTVYGVTMYGARRQILKQLQSLDNFPKDLNFNASYYLMKLTFQSLGQIFNSARMIQHWLTDVANLISKDCMQSVRWRTPLNFPVTQPYYRQKMVKMMYDDGKLLFGKRGHGFNVSSGKPDSAKQRHGFPPNFIHSLDSSHMMLTSLYCQKEGLTFASVHDCFWTHPPFVARMNHILRQQFVALHSQSILENMGRWFIDAYLQKGEWNDDERQAMKYYMRNRFASLPKKGDFDLNEVLSSTYFFS